MKVLIKLGGTLLDTSDSLAALAQQIARAATEHEIAVVHGGGKQVTRYLAGQGVQSQFVNGLRVSDSIIIDAVTNVIAGGINKRLVAAIIAAGRSAVGISGIDGSLTTARQLNSELQFVGQPVRTDSRLLDLLIDAAFTPVVACVAADPDGQIFNVNADNMAVSCAVGWGAARLLFLTDVGGVRGREGQWLSRLTSADARHLIQTGVATGGMQAKLEAAELAVAAGMEVTIASGSQREIISHLLSGNRLGTHWSPLATEDEATFARHQYQ